MKVDHVKSCPYPTVAELDADSANDVVMIRMRAELKLALDEGGEDASPAEVDAELDEVLKVANRLNLASRLCYILDDV